MVGRSVGEKMAALLGQPVVADNRPGGNAAIATDIVAKAPHDGHTWLLATVSHVVTPHLQKVEYDPIGDFAGVAYLCSVPPSPSCPRLAVQDHGRDHRQGEGRAGQADLSEPGRRHSMHLNMEMVKVRTGAAITPVPYRGLPPGMSDLLEGRLDSPCSRRCWRPRTSAPAACARWASRPISG